MTVETDLHCSDEGGSNPVKAPLVDRLLFFLKGTMFMAFSCFRGMKVNAPETH